jgi:putative transposase
MICRNRRPSLYIDHALYLYFLGLSTRGVAKALSFLNIVKRGRVANWKWIQKHGPQKISLKRKNISNLIVD